MGRALPDGVNPRTHTAECLKSPVSKKIEQTLKDNPEDFFLANRGSTILVDSLEYDPKTGRCVMTITDTDNHGLADGATTDAVLAKVQTQFARELLEKTDATWRDVLDGVTNGKGTVEMPEALLSGRIHLEVIVNLTDRTRLANLVEGRNTSRQVKGWSMADFKGEFDWLKAIIDATNSPFMGKVGYEENSSQDLNILDILSVLTLFHPEFDEEDEMGQEKAPVMAYANKGRMDARLADNKLREGYKKLTPIVGDILKLWEYTYANFEAAYDAAFGVKSRLGRREGVIPVHDNPIELPLTGLKSNYKLPAGYVFPLLAGFRALVKYNGSKVGWAVDPFAFFDKYGKRLVSELMSQVEGQGGNPNVAGKRKLVYTAIHAKAQIFLNAEKGKE